MQDIVMEIVSKYGYWGIVFLIFVENIFPPIPSELILTFGGFITTKTELSVIGMTISATLGSCLGAIVLYELGRMLSPEKLAKFADSKLGRRLHFKNEDIDNARRHFLKQGNNTVFFCRFIPIVRSMISIPAGMSGMTFGRFMLLTTLGSFAWNIVLISLGAVAGEAWNKVLLYAKGYSSAVKLVVILALIALTVRPLIKIFRKNKNFS